MAMVKDQLFGKTMRKSYAKYQEILEMPNLLKIQKDSYQWFLETGLREVFKDVGTITDFSGKLELSFLDYTMEDKPKYTIEECKERDATYAKPIKVRVRLRNTETDEIKEQEIFMGDFPVMTNGGTFVINGAERVIISQIVRSPGMYYGHEVDKADQHTYTATVIPYRGAWLEYETDNANVFWVRIDKNRKLPITCLIRALGVQTDEQIKQMFGEDARILATIDKDPCKTREESLLEIYRRLRPGEPPTVETATAHLEGLLFDAHRYDVSTVGRYKFNKKMDIWSRLSGQEAAEPIADPMTGEILVMPGEFISRAQAHELSRKGVNEAVIKVGDTNVKVFSNNMVDMKGFVDFDPVAECGIKERVCKSVLEELLAKYEGEELKEAIQNKITELNNNIEAGKNTIIGELNQRATIKSKMGRFDTMMEQINIRKAELNSRLLRAKSDEAAREETVKKLEETFKTVTEELRQMTEQEAASELELGNIRENLTGLDAKLRETQTRFHQEQSKLEALTNITERYDGYGGSVKKVMEQKEKEKGIIGVVADIIQVEAKYETAIETALGGNIQNIVTDNEETAKHMIGFLKQNRLGRATFLPLTSITKPQEFKNPEALKEKCQG